MTPPLNDPRIRLALIPYLKSLTPNLWVRCEMGLNKCVADLVTVSNTELHVYEIKSDVDTTKRLQDRVKRGRYGRTYTRKGQVTAYSAMADKVTLVVGKVLLAEALELIPEWWGILVADDLDGVVRFTQFRRALDNPDLRWVNVFKFLWRTELIGLCERFGVGKGVRSISKAKMKKRLKDAKLSLEDLRSEVREVLRTRVWEYKF